MNEGRRQSWREHGFLLLLVVLCAVLTVLQFHWTGELARAEFERLGGDQRDAAEAFTREFDRELGGGVGALMPPGRQFSRNAVTARVKAWHEGNPRPVFSKLALAVVKADGLELEGIDLESGGMTVMPTWPEAWKELEENLEEKMAGLGDGPYRDEAGMLFEIPIQGGRPPPGGGGGRGRGPGGPGGTGGPPPGEMGWMIFEMDAAYLEGTWLPELVKRHFNPGARDVHRVEILGPGGTIFSSGPRERLEPPVVMFFNRQGRNESSRGGPPGELTWQLKVSRQAGALEEMVASSRRRNLALACGVNGLILVAGYALIRQTRKSRLLAEARMNFVANVSHELRTPVTVILGAAHNMKRGIIKKPEAQERYADLILQYGQQLSDMVQEVLEFSAVKPGMALRTKAPVAVDDLLRETVEELKADLAEMEVEVSLEDDLPMVAGDAQGLRRVFRNLIGNAAKHGGEGKWIGISAAKVAGTRVEIVVADRGPGVPPGEQAKIFEPFFRGARAHLRQTRGTGLGLGLVREIVAGHGGKVSVCSHAGGGASFTVSLPIAGAAGHGSEDLVGRG